MTAPRLAIFTICANNYVAFARILFASARTHHPTADLFLCLVDRMLDAPGLYDPDWTVVPADQLEIHDFPEFSFRYEILELSTAVKPFMFRYLLDDRDYDAVLYFDPDIQIFRPLDGVLSLLAGGASFVLTPHLLAPAESRDEPNDVTMLRAGAYNLGFLAAARGEESKHVLAWWARRLRFDCINDQGRGLFVDQKFFDLTPSFAQGTRIIHDVTLNVAYWNIRQRALSGPKGGWRVDGQKLTFFHFSGFDPNMPWRLSKHDPHGDDPVSAPLRHLTGAYAEALLSAGHGAVPADLYAYARFSSGTLIHPLVRQMFRAWHQFWPDNPFDSYEAFLHEPWPGASRDLPSHTVTNFQKYLYDRLPNLNVRLDLEQPEHARELVDWYVTHAAHEWRLDLQLIEPVTARMGLLRRRSERAHKPQGRAATQCDVTVVGYLRTASGVGEVARQTLRTLTTGGLKAEGIDVELGVAAARDDTSVTEFLVGAGTAPVQLFNINADQLPAVLVHLRSQLRRDAFRINIPFWELSRFPDAWMPAFAEMDEIWAPSRFIQMALAGRVERPVIHMPIAIELTPPPPLPRAHFGLPEDRFLFFYAFDFLSFMERKNPRAAIAAFRQAFATRGRAGLVLKCMNGSLVPDQFTAFQEAIGADPDITLIDATLSRADTLALICATDSVVSLHRSEGFGLLIAEAMLLGKPVIATDYSASREFVNEATGYPVGYQLVPVRDGDYPFANGQVWADPDVAHAAWHMRRLVEVPEEAVTKMKRAAAYLRENYSRANISILQTRRLHSLLTE